MAFVAQLDASTALFRRQFIGRARVGSRVLAGGGIKGFVDGLVGKLLPGRSDPYGGVDLGIMATEIPDPSSGTKTAEPLGTEPPKALFNVYVPPNPHRMVLGPFDHDVFLKPGGATLLGTDPLRALIHSPTSSLAAKLMLRTTGADRMALEDVVAAEIEKAKALVEVSLPDGDTGTYQVLWLENGSKVTFRPGGESELISYRVSHRLGVGLVPPTVPYRWNEKWGTAELWVDGTEGYHHAGTTDPMHRPWEHPATHDRLDALDANAFDYLLNTPDRHGGNWLIAFEGNGLILFDHQGILASPGDMPGRLEGIEKIGRDFFEQLEGLSNAELRALAIPPKKLIDDPSSAAWWEKCADNLLERRADLVAHVRGLIAERGEENVFVG
jgi:hypothetical protein